MSSQPSPTTSSKPALARNGSVRNTTLQLSKRQLNSRTSTSLAQLRRGGSGGSVGPQTKPSRGSAASAAVAAVSQPGWGVQSESV